MNNQELFDKVATHLLTQNAKSMTDIRTSDALAANQVCAYRGNHGRKCAAGCLILDKHYSYELETMRCDSSAAARALIKSGIDECQINIVRELQVVHDVYPVTNWKTHLNDVAIMYDVSSEVILKF